MNLLRDWGHYMAAFYSKPIFTDGNRPLATFRTDNGISKWVNEQKTQSQL